MIKLSFCLVRLPHLTREAFQTYWLGTHSPLVASMAEALQIRRYVQTHSLPAEVQAPGPGRSRPAAGGRTPLHRPAEVSALVQPRTCDCQCHLGYML